jgi:hypothetical protein
MIKLGEPMKVRFLPAAYVESMLVDFLFLFRYLMLLLRRHFVRRYYPTILHMTRNLPDDRVSELRVRSIVLSLVYLVHRYFIQ